MAATIFKSLADILLEKFPAKFSALAEIFRRKILDTNSSEEVRKILLDGLLFVSDLGRLEVKSNFGLTPSSFR